MRLSKTSTGKIEEPIGKPFYAVLAVYIPLSIVFFAGIVSVKMLLYFKPDLFVSFTTIMVMSAVSCLAASVYFFLIKNVQSGRSAADIRGAVFTVLAGYSISSIFSFSLPPGQRFFPVFTNVISALSSLYCWASVLSIKEMFHARELFEAYTFLYSGDKLQSVMLEDAPRMSAALEQFRQTRRVYVFEILLIGILLIVLKILHIPFEPALSILFLFLIVNACLLCTVLGLFIREHYFAGEGIAVSNSNRYKRLLGAAFFSFSAAFCALLLARDDSLLPLSALLDFIAFILGFLSRLFRPPKIDGAAMERLQVPNPLNTANPLLPDMAETEPWPFWEQLWTWLRYALISAAVLGFVWFMLKPFFARLGIVKGAITFFKNLRLYLYKWFAGLKLGLFSFIDGLKNRNLSVKIHRSGIEELNRISRDILEGLSPEKRRKLKASVSLFSRLILWGTETTGLAWKPSRAPGEYCALLAERVVVQAVMSNDAGNSLGTKAAKTAASADGNTAQALIQCGVLFEKALYARNPLSAVEQKKFKTLIEGITTL
ncbi:MAG: hypothetical protein LBQ88_00180 [Treponema sp.]|jgi:hypothetical protein|nr:hypothetical protein [Treponema sp.]